MALLLAMYQKMRLVRERNELSLELVKTTSKYNRVKKNITRVQKMFESRKAKLESQAKLMQNQAQSVFRQMSGLFMNAGAYTNPYQMGGSNAYINQQIQMLMGSKLPFGFKDGKIVSADDANGAYSISSDSQQALMYLYQTGRINSLTAKEGEDGKYFYKDAKGEERSISAEDYAAFQQIINQANQNYYTAQNFLQTSTDNYNNNVSIWLQTQTEQLEAEQEAAVEPLSYQETMWELDKNQIEERLEEIKNEINNLDKPISEGAQEMAPKFGL